MRMDRVNKIYLVRLRKGEERLGLIGRIEEVSVIIEDLVHLMNAPNY